jgi:hypothetical protein
VWLPLLIQKVRVSLLAGFVLQGERDRVPEAAARHRVLIRKEPTILSAPARL